MTGSQPWVLFLAGAAVALVVAAVALVVYEGLATPRRARPTQLLTASVGLLVAAVATYVLIVALVAT